MHLFCCLDRCKHSKARNDFYSTMSNASSMHNARLPSTTASFHTANLSVLEFTVNNKFNGHQYSGDIKDDFDPGFDNQPLCQIHRTLHKSTLPGYQSQYPENINQLGYKTYNPTSAVRNDYLKPQREKENFSDLNIPRRPVLGQFSAWHSNSSTPTHKLAETANSSPHLVNSYSQGNIYAEVDPEYEVDSGFTDELSDQTCDRTEDSLYNSSSSNSNAGYYHDHLAREGISRPEFCNSVKPSMKESRSIKDEKLKVFAISKTLQHRNTPYSSEVSEDKPVSGLWHQRTHDQNTRKTKTGTRLSHKSGRAGDGQNEERDIRPTKCQIHNYYSSCEHL